MNATVVIPTRDRVGPLRRCLAAVRGQQYEGLDVVVVDDGSRAAAPVSAVAEEFGALLIRLTGEGPAAARNAGARVAATDRVLLLDDDCVPGPGWAQALSGDFVPSRAVVAGGVAPPRGASVWLRASEQIAVGAEEGSGFFRTLNLSCPTALLHEVPFDETFPSAAGEDRDWCFRARAAGATFVREPTAIVEHHADLDARAFLAQQVRYGRAVRRLQLRGTHVAVPGGVHVRGLGAGFREGIPIGLAMATAPLATAAGYMVERLSESPG